MEWISYVSGVLYDSTTFDDDDVLEVHVKLLWSQESQLS